MHKWILTLSLAALAIPLNANALGLGDINVRSALNQSFNAEIELLSVRPDELDSLTVTLASSAAFAQAGLERPVVLTQLRFQIETKGNGKPYLRVFSQDPIKEPFLNYLIEVNWASGHLLREYTVLLDPPVGLVTELPTVPAPAADSSKPASLPTNQRQSTSLFESSPGKPSSESSSSPAPAAKVSQSPSRIQTSSDGSSYGPTQRGEGLWSIAKSLLPADGSADVNQMMLALLKTNPEAFINNNINAMKAGYVLRAPSSSELTALSRQQALSLVNEQTALWKDPAFKRALKTPTPTDSAVAQQNSSAEFNNEAPQVPDTSSSNAQLKLVPATDTPAAGATPEVGEQAIASEKQAVSGETVVPASASVQQSAESASEVAEPTNSLDAAQAANIERSRLDALSKDLTLATESLEAKRLENEELSSRLAELATQTESVQRLIDLKNEELAVLQQTTGESQELAAPISLDARADEPAQAEAVVTDKSVADKANNVANGGLGTLRNSMTELSRNPMVQGITALAALLIVSLLWIINRRRRINTRIIETPSLPNFRTMPIASVAGATVQPSALTSLTRNDSTEVVAQADHKFEETLADPQDRHEVQLKLLDIYHLTNSKNAFAAQAEALYADLGGRGGALWDKVVVMGREICPDHPLFGGTKQAPPPEYNDLPEFITESSAEPLESSATQEVFPEVDLDISSWKSADTQTDSNSIEFDFTPATVPTSSVNEPELQDDLSSYDLASQYGLKILARDQALEPVAKTDSDIPVDDFNAGHTFDFDLEKEADLLAKANAELTASADDQFSGGLEFESGLLIDADEVSTKLELARAYIEMGDPEGAQSILDEVMKEGDEDQRQEAQALMQQVG